jgi:hypothetical protein
VPLKRQAACLLSKWPAETHEEALADSVVAMPVFFLGGAGGWWGGTGSTGFESLRASWGP